MDLSQMADMMQKQRIMNMKNQLTFLESQFNLLLMNMQNIGLEHNFYANLINISFQFIDFGIQLLNIGIPHRFNIWNNINIESLLVKHIKDLENIEQKYFIDSKIFYNVIFEFSKSETYLVPCEGNKTIDFLMKEFLKKIGRCDLFDMEDKEFSFIYNSSKFNSRENKCKNLNDFFGKATTQLVFCKKLGRDI